MKIFNFVLLSLLCFFVTSLEIQGKSRHLLSNFVQYCKIDTQSDPNSRTVPSTEKQKNLAKLLVKQLLQYGLKDAHMDSNGYVMATLPSNSDKKVTTIGFISHMDTSPAVSGTNVKPILHKNYQLGKDLVHPETGKVILKFSETPNLKNVVGHDLITADGITLLGADDKSGCAAIMEAVRMLVTNPQIKHGDIKFGFTPDEEIGRGATHFDVKKFGAKYAFTVDGSELGEISTETFSADAAVIKFHGVSMHPGTAKGKLINSQKMAAYFLSLLPKDKLSPETTEGREGFVHPTTITGNEELTTLRMVIRDFDNKKLNQHGEFLKSLVDRTVEAFPKGARAEIVISEQYRNMKEIIDKHPVIKKNALIAMEKLSIKPIEFPIRGGTDGSMLSFMGLPCPNIFTGGQNFHSNSEWASLQDMQQSADFVVKIAEVFEETA
eukprot:gene12491-6239_t